MSGNQRVLVVGGGLIGAASAYYLRRLGREVTLIDQGSFGGGCSHGNCGYVCPSHVLPHAAPGALWNTLKTLLARNSPLKVRWRLDPALWSWFWRFARRCNERDMLSAGHALQALLQSSRTLYDDLFASSLSNVEWEPSGLLFVFLSQAGFEHYAPTDALLRREFHLPAERLDAAALQALEPALKPEIAGAWRYPGDGTLRPDKLMRAWRERLEQDGVEIREQCALQDLTSSGRLARRAITSTGELPADQVLIATGAWTPQLQKLLRRPIAIQPGKGYSLTMPRPALCPRNSMIFEEHRVAITPLPSCYRIGSTMEFAGYDASLNPARLKLLRDGAAIYLREPTAEPVIEQWWGWRPMTPDGLPFIGALPAWDNVYLAAGHGMLGLSLSPGTGKLAAELLSGSSPHLDPTPYSVIRK